MSKKEDSTSETLEKTLIEVADISTKLVRHPETSTIDRLNSLYDYCKNKNTKISRKAILSLAAVLFEILPDYSIGKHSGRDNPSKEVRFRREHEQLLYDFTRRFIQFTEMTAFARTNSLKLRIAAGKALAGLFHRKTRFNTANHLTKVVLRLSCCSVPRLREIGCESLKQVFHCDPTGDLTLMIVSELPLLKIDNISSDLLQALMDIHLHSESELKSDDSPEKQDKKSKKVGKKADDEEIQDEALKRELMKIDIIDNKSEKRKNQATILAHLFGTVFRFLRETKSEPHFIAAMDIIRDKVEFINYEYVDSIISALKQSRFSLRACITGAQTALCVSQTAKLSLDLRDFYVTVYARAYEALEDRKALLEFLALFTIISKNRETDRTAAFAKRLMVMALLATADVTAAILCTIRKTILDHPQFTGANDFEFQGEGEYQLLGEDPDFCYGQFAKNWELSVFTHSPSPIVREIALDLAKLKDNDAINDSKIRAASKREQWDPQHVLEALDDSSRIFDTNLLTIQKKTPPKSFKVFNFQ